MQLFLCVEQCAKPLNSPKQANYRQECIHVCMCCIDVYHSLLICGIFWSTVGALPVRPVFDRHVVHALQVGFHSNKLVKKVRVEKRINDIVNRLNKTKQELYPDLAAEREHYDRGIRAVRRAEVQVYCTMCSLRPRINRRCFTAQHCPPDMHQREHKLCPLQAAIMPLT